MPDFFLFMDPERLYVQGHYMAEVRLEPPFLHTHTCTHLGLSLPGVLFNCCSEAHRDQVNSLGKNFVLMALCFIHDVLKSCPVKRLDFVHSLPLFYLLLLF